MAILLDEAGNPLLDENGLPLYDENGPGIGHNSLLAIDMVLGFDRTEDEIEQDRKRRNRLSRMRFIHPDDL